jgi:tRNA-splicing ligase RtcB
MISFNDIEKIGPFEWEIGKKKFPFMHVPVRIFSNEEMLKDALQDRSIEQAMNAAALPGVLGSVCVMPDVHQGYGFPIGGVAATDFNAGVISPGAIGYDINCGVRLMASDMPYQDARDHIEKFTIELFKACPSGVGEKGIVKLSSKELAAVCREGSGWALKNGYAQPNDIHTTEDGGCIPDASVNEVSQRAFERGSTQIGSLGAGNHFIEVDIIEEVYDPQAAGVMGIQQGNIALQLHSGSRGFGHQICTDFVRAFQAVTNKYRISLPDRELVCAPLQSSEGQQYLAAMRCAANYAFCNRQVLAYSARNVFEEFFPHFHLRNVYDLAHNIGKIEDHQVDGSMVKVCVHRKGATRAFSPGHADLPDCYRQIGQPVLVPGSMGTQSWVMTGTQTAMEKTFGSCSHGAGRVLSRTQAKKSIRGDQLRLQLLERGIYIQAGSMRGLAEEAPQAYKDINAVIASIEGAGLGKKVARLRPVAVIKG